MSDLDKLFKKKFEQRSFEFKDAYWQAAEQLIDAEEGKRRRRIGWWWFGILCLLGFSVGAFYHSQSYAADQPKDGGNDPVISTTTNQEPLATSGEKEAEIRLLEQRSASSTGTTNEEKSNGSEAATDQQSPENHLSGSEATGQRNTPNAEEGYVSEPRNPAISGERTGEQKNITSAANNNTDLNNTSIISSTEQSKNTVPTSDGSTKSSGESYEKSLTTSDAPDPASESEKITPVVALELLETRGAESIAGPDEAKSFEKIIKDFAPSPWRFGLDLATLYNVSTVHKGYSGLAFGAKASYAINPRWSLQSGLRYSIRDPRNFASYNNNQDDVISAATEELGDFNSTFISTSNFYNFGLIEVNEITLVEQFHFIELPLGLQYQTGRHLIGLGGQLNYLSGVRGTQTLLTSMPVASSNDPGDPEIVPGSTSKGWLDRSYYRKWTSEVQLSYGFLLNPRWGIYASANYQMFDNGLIQTNQAETMAAFDNFRSVTNVDENRLYFRLGMHYTIGK